MKSLATILVDYENVSTNDGLKGVEYLNKNDTLLIRDGVITIEDLDDFSEELKQHVQLLLGRRMN